MKIIIKTSNTYRWIHFNALSAFCYASFGLTFSTVESQEIKLQPIRHILVWDIFPLRGCICLWSIINVLIHLFHWYNSTQYFFACLETKLKTANSTMLVMLFNVQTFFQFNLIFCMSCTMNGVLLFILNLFIIYSFGHSRCRCSRWVSVSFCNVVLRYVVCINLFYKRYAYLLLSFALIWSQQLIHTGRLLSFVQCYVVLRRYFDCHFAWLQFFSYCKLFIYFKFIFFA